MNALSWDSENAGDGTFLRSAAHPSPAVSYEINVAAEGLYVNRIIKQGTSSFSWPLESAAKDLATAIALAQSDWDNLHG